MIIEIHKITLEDQEQLADLEIQKVQIVQPGQETR
jgi:hypothetical protein